MLEKIEQCLKNSPPSHPSISFPIHLCNHLAIRHYTLLTQLGKCLK